MYEIAQSGHVPVISAMGNLPILKDLVVDMEPFWKKFKAVNPYLQPGYEVPPGGKEHRISQERMNVINKESLCINCGCCVSECNAMESDPDFLGPQALAKAMRFVGDPRDAGKIDRLELLNGKNGIWQCTRCYFCNERCPKGVDPRDAIAKLGAESVQGRHRPRHGREAREVVRHARRRRPAGCARRSSCRRRRGSSSRSSRRDSPSGWRASARCRRRSRRTSRRTSGRRAGCTSSSPSRIGRATRGIVQGEAALAKLAHGYHEGERDPYGPGSFPKPYIAGEDGDAA